MIPWATAHNTASYSTPWLCTLVLAALLSGCDRQPPAVHSYQLLALGTLVDVSLYGVDDDTAEATVEVTRSIMETIHHDWHAWQPSRLTVINDQLANGESVTLSAEEAQLLNTGLALSQRSDGLFNPAIGALSQLWGFHSDERDDRPPPTPQAIKAVLDQHASMADLALSNHQLNSTNPNVQLDLGGYAKGYAVDLTIAAFRKMGISNAIVNAGGDLRAIGAKGDRPWRIGVRHPRQPGVVASIDSQGDESVFTSGDYERYFDHGEQRYHHIIDPRDGYPAAGTTSVTVIHSDAATADAAATALFIAGPAQWRETARNMGIELAMLIDAQNTVHLTAAMAERVWFEVDPKPPIIIED